MAEQGEATRECPFCREEVRADALRCKHCQAALAPTRPDHGGTCPFCKEQINPEAIRCKHCRADLLPRRASGCAGCGGNAGRLKYVAHGRAAITGLRRAVPRGTRSGFGSRGVDPSLLTGLRLETSTCPPIDVDDDGLWGYIGEDEDNCYYQLLAPITHTYGVFDDGGDLVPYNPH